MTQRLRRPLTLVVPLVTSLALAGGAMAAVAQTEVPEVPVLNAEQPKQPARGLIVKFVDGAEGEIADVANDAEAELPAGVEVADTEEGAELGLVALSEEVQEPELDDAIERLEADPRVEWVVPNGVRYPTATANDPLFSQMWSLRQPWGVEADQAWDISTGRSSVRVAVLDTGILKRHPDLAGQQIKGRDFVDADYLCRDAGCKRRVYTGRYFSANDKNGWDSDSSDPGDWRSNFDQCYGMDPGPSSWHGTHVAGTIAAKRNNRLGGAGIAPGVRVQPVRVLGRCGGTDWDITTAILWSAGVDVTRRDKGRKGKVRIPVNKRPAKVINLSLGGMAPSVSQARAACRPYAAAARIARARGSLVVAAAGNSALDPAYRGDHRLSVPSSCSGFVSVAATDQQGRRAVFSNYGPGIDVAAPGVGIISTYNAGRTKPGAHGFASSSGTSMAAPAVSATAALAYSVGITNPDVVLRVLKASARRAATCTAAQCGAGVVSARGVLRAKAPTSAPRISGSPQPGGTLRATPGSWRNGATVQLRWYHGSKVVATGSTYRPTRADLGRRLVVRATASNGHPAIFHQSTVVVKSKSRVSMSIASKFSKSKRARLTVKVRAPYVRATGTIRVYDGKKRIAVKKIYSKNKGKVTIKLPKIKKKGKHRIRVIYSGSAKVSSAQKSKVVRVR